MLNFNLFARRTTKKTKNNKKIHEPVLFLYSVDKCPLCLSSWEICLSMRQISLRERVESAWFTRYI